VGEKGGRKKGGEGGGGGGGWPIYLQHANLVCSSLI